MPEPEDNLPSLEALQRQIDAAKRHGAAKKPGAAPVSGVLGQAMRHAGEFIAGAGVGSLCGYGLDRWLGTSPLGFLTGFVLGFAAGVYNLMREIGRPEE